MKKLIAIVLTFAAIGMALSGCSGQSENSNSSSKAESSQTENTQNENSSQTLEEIQSIEQGYMDQGMQSALDASLDRPYVIWFPQGTSPRHCAGGYASMADKSVMPICIAGSLEYSPDYGVDITQIKANEDILPVMTNSFAKLVAYQSFGYQDNGKLQISSTEIRTLNDMDACHSKGTYSYEDDYTKEGETFQFVAYSLMWDTDTPFFAAVLDLSEEQNQLDRCEEALEFMISTLREPDESEY